MANNPGDFPDWNSDWDERDYWDICVIKDLTRTINIKFHGEQYNSIRLTTGDAPAIFEHIVFRDVYISNSSGTDADFDVILVNNRTIDPPPRKPTNLEVEVQSPTTIKATFLDNTEKGASWDEDYFKVERSAVGPAAGFVQIGTVTKPALLYTTYPATRSYTDATCIGLTQYWYRIRSYNSTGGNSPYSNVATATTP
jgi:hypothetical protein